jgi:dethiobiotin synthetase
VKGLCVAGIGTEVGKTVASAVVCEALGWDYWKPVASGLADGPGDGEIITSLIENGRERVHPSRYLFARSLSPHVASALEGVTIALDELQMPRSTRSIVVELAGGVFVPLNDQHTNLDLITALKLPAVVVSRHYLGSINHTLLTLEALRHRELSVHGVIFNGEELPDTERIICTMGRVQRLGRIPQLAEVSYASVQEVAKTLSLQL